MTNREPSQLQDLTFLDPISDLRWQRLLDSHPEASVFHTPGWLKALRSTYGYSPAAIAASGLDGEIEAALVFCQVGRRLTGSKLVSVPFSDHCGLLDCAAGRLGEVLKSVSRVAGAAGTVPAGAAKAAVPDFPGLRGRVRSLELRPLGQSAATLLRGCGFAPCESFLYHEVDLRPGPEQLFRATHKDSVQRKIRKAEREGLVLRAGRSPEVLGHFYRLLTLARRRHGVPPQPRSWFENLVNALGESLLIRVAYAGALPTAAILTLSCKERLVFKYGGSDERYQASGGTQALFWKAMEEACSEGMTVFDLGRTDPENAGLATFKERWGAVRQELTYWKYPPPARPAAETRTKWATAAAKAVFRRLPPAVLEVLGRWVYRYLG